MLKSLEIVNDRIFYSGAQQTRARKNTAVKRRPLATSYQQIYFMNKDTSSAILSSQVIAKKVQSKSKVHTNLTSLSQLKKKTKPKHSVDNVPRFTSIPRKFQDLCRNKSVDEILTSKFSVKDSIEFKKRYV